MENERTTDGEGGRGGGGFECNICFRLAEDPVITLCGHLHCWPCLYQRLQLHSQSHECPVCKAVVKEEELIPLYGRGGDTAFQQRLVPRRPPGRRPPTVAVPQRNGGRRRGLFVPTVMSVRFREVSSAYGSFGEGGEDRESGGVEERNIDDNLKKILIFIFVFVVFDFLII